MTTTQQPWDGSGDSWEDDHTQKKKKRKEKGTNGQGRDVGMREAAGDAGGGRSGLPAWPTDLVPGHS